MRKGRNWCSSEPTCIGHNARRLHPKRDEGDRLFDYDLTFSLFNRIGSFRLTAEGFHMAFQNARGEKDAGIIIDCIDCLVIVGTRPTVSAEGPKCRASFAVPFPAPRDCRHFITSFLGDPSFSLPFRTHGSFGKTLPTAC